MIYTEKIQKAIKFAAKTHQVYQDQKRKGKDVPYITHPLTVGLILSLAGAHEDVIVAGILHDTIEDSPKHKKVSREMLEERFGKKVADLVDSVTEKERSRPWEDRKREAVEHIAHFTEESALLKSADLLSNVAEIIDDYARFGEQVFERFHESKEKTIRHYADAISAVISRWPKNPLLEDLKIVLKKIKNIDQRD